MSTVLETPARAVEPAHPARSWAAVFALARFEARELRMIAASLGVAVLYVAWVVRQVTQRQGDYPVLQDVDRDTQGMPVLVGLVVMLGVNRAVLRSHRRDTDRHFDVLVVEPWRRTVAHALSIVPAVLFTAVCVARPVHLGRAQARRGRPRFARRTRRRPADGPAVRRVRCPSRPSVPLGLRRAGHPRPPALRDALRGALVRLQLDELAGSGRHRERLLPVPLRPAGPPRRLARPVPRRARPARWPCVAVLRQRRAYDGRQGGRRRIARRSRWWALSASPAGTPAGSTPARERATNAPEKVQSCLKRGGSTYCAFPEWTRPHRRLGRGRRPGPEPRGRQRRGRAADRTAAHRRHLRAGRPTPRSPRRPRPAR